jgi:hypothetical protein
MSMVNRIDFQFFAEGPLVKDKGSFLIGGSSYAHLFLKFEEQKTTRLIFMI